MDFNNLEERKLEERKKNIGHLQHTKTWIE